MPKPKRIRYWIRDSEKKLNETKSETETRKRPLVKQNPRLRPSTLVNIQNLCQLYPWKNPYYLILELKVAESSVLNGHTYWTHWHCLINLVFKKFGSKINYYPMCSRLTYSSRIRIWDCAYALTNLALNLRLRKYPKRDWIRDQTLLDSRFLDGTGIPADLCSIRLFKE